MPESTCALWFIRNQVITHDADTILKFWFQILNLHQKPVLDIYNMLHADQVSLMPFLEILTVIAVASVMNIYSFRIFLLFVTRLFLRWSHDRYHFVTLLFFLSFRLFHLIYAYHIPILSRYYLGSSLLLSYASIFRLIYIASYLFDYLRTSYIPTYCSTFHSLPIGRSTPLISWHCSSLSFLLSSEYSLHSYW